MLRLASVLGFVAWIAPLALPAQDTTRISLDPNGREGAKAAGTPAGLAEQVSVVITCVSDTTDVEEVLLGEHGVNDFHIVTDSGDGKSGAMKIPW